MVKEKEFTSLQGRMGGIYARLQEEPEEVASAVAEQYLPNFVGDKLPETRLGALLSIADKVDNIVATFLTGEIPTGSEDPFALRRQATGLLTIILEQNLPIDIGELVLTAVSLFPAAKSEYAAQIPAFFRERLNALLTEHGIRYDVAAAVMETSWQQPAQAQVRANALSAFRDQPEFEKLVVGQKRVANILGTAIRLPPRADGDSPTERLRRTQRGTVPIRHKAVPGGPPEAALFVEPTEKLLWSEACKVEPDLDRCLAAHDYKRAFELLLGLRPVIDKFFDDVLVMAEDKALRENRLKLLGHVRSLFGKVADLSKIVIEGE
jgi:glycyl-tRNA synthetase beta chain